MRTISLLIFTTLFLWPQALFAQSHATVTGALDVSALREGHAARLAVILDVGKGFHAQSHTPLDDSAIKCELTLDPVPGITFGDIAYPDGKVEEYPQLGKLSVYTGKTIIYVPVTVTGSAPPGKIKLTGKLEMQICDNNTCFPPDSDVVSVDTEIVPEGTAVEPTNQDLFPKQAATQPASAQPPTPAPAAQHASADHPFSLLGFSGNIDSVFGAMIAAFIAGLIFNVMPCVLPVLPLKAIGFYEVSQHDRKKTILLGSVFSLGVIAVFAALAVIVFCRNRFSAGNFPGASNSPARSSSGRFRRF